MKTRATQLETILTIFSKTVYALTTQSGNFSRYYCEGGPQTVFQKIKTNLCIRLFSTALFITANIKTTLSAHM